MTSKQVGWLAMVALIVIAALLAGWASLSAAPQGLTYYVRTDGGSASACTGLVDAAYPGSGTHQPCAWDHPFRALPPGDTPRIAGGDTLVIGAGSYRMGYGAPGADACDAGSAFDCLMPPIPSGPDPAHRTRILGAGWNTGCAAPPQLWGAIWGLRVWVHGAAADGNLNTYEYGDGRTHPPAPDHACARTHAYTDRVTDRNAN